MSRARENRAKGRKNGVRPRTDRQRAAATFRELGKRGTVSKGKTIIRGRETEVQLVRPDGTLEHFTYMDDILGES